MPLAAIGQICSTASMSHNLHQCAQLIQKASSVGAAALFLPEASDYITSNATESLALVKSVHQSDFVLGICAQAKKHRMPVNVGIHEPTSSGSKVKNTLLWIDRDGNIAHRYQKLHLFDVDIKGGPILKESNSVEPGLRIVDPFPTALGSVGMMICFDLRFAEPALALRNRGAQLLTYPSAFTVPTGRAHWETLLRARAIETQSYVIAAAQVGSHNTEGTRRSYGHSMIVDPWGKVVVELGGDCDEKSTAKDKGDIAFAEIDLDYLEKVRREMPLLRRADVYSHIM